MFCLIPQLGSGCYAQRKPNSQSKVNSGPRRGQQQVVENWGLGRRQAENSQVLMARP